MSDVKFNDPCEWNPEQNRAAYTDEVHANADFIVGYNGKWRLCASCAALDVFKPYRKRIPVKKTKDAE